MNLFCFSLEGSMDSLYEAVQSSGDGPPPPIPSRSSSRSHSRSCSPAVLLDDNARRGPGRCVSMEMPQTHGTISNKKKRRTHLSKSASDNEILDNPGCNAAAWQPAKSQEDLVHTTNNHNEEVRKSKNRAEIKGGKGAQHSGPKKKEKHQPHQVRRKYWISSSVQCLAVRPSKCNEGGSEWLLTANSDINFPVSWQEVELCFLTKEELEQRAKACLFAFQSTHTNGESKTAVKRNQKTGKKPPGRSGKEGSKKVPNSRIGSPPGPMSPSPGAQYLDLPYASRSDRMLHLGKSSTLPAQENTTPGRCADVVILPGGATPTHHQRWSNPGDNNPAWGTVQHTCRRPLTEYRMYSPELTSPPEKESAGRQQPAAIQGDSLKRDRKPQIPPKVPRSITEVDLSEPNRSTSFGRFDGLRNHSSNTKPEENGTSMLREECESPDPNKSAGLGKKMKEISLTMRRKMGKKHAKSFSEEAGDDTDKDPETENGPSAEKSSTISLESLYSGQSASSGVTSESNGSGQRDSLRLEEDGSYQGPFCSRARVHTDFVPSPYDTDSLKLKVGDIIQIISKPPMGIWTGMLNNKVGNFKFIYVDIVEEEEEEEEAPKIRPQKLCKRPRPKTLLELLERLNLEEYASALLLNGYQTVEDLLHLQEKHLIELNVKDPEHRLRLLAAAECRYTEGDDTKDVQDHNSSPSLQEEDSDCPRDSGCFIPSECSDSKEDPEQVTDVVDS
ncbi:SAM domain-containing protein SAMSN-1a [Cololabis saira]|uniref:SAM domain-containing protein SAMSN-1a n=1 Tax=Cololabis saira TaxID=129043 RepID=UPI002AD3EE76|nr:SAM domain-containing protein SAMSN-1a [Cololabis saira]